MNTLLPMVDSPEAVGIIVRIITATIARLRKHALPLFFTVTPKPIHPNFYKSREGKSLLVNF